MIDSLRSQVSATQATEQATHGIDFEQRGERAGQAAIGSGPVAAGGSHAATHRKRQPPHDRAGETGRRLRPGPGAGGKQSEGAAATVQSLKDQVSAARSRPEYRARQYPPGACGCRARCNPRADSWPTPRPSSRKREVRLGYTKIYAPVTGTVSVRAALRR